MPSTTKSTLPVDAPLGDAVHATRAAERGARPEVRRDTVGRRGRVRHGDGAGCRRGPAVRRVCRERERVGPVAQRGGVQPPIAVSVELIGSKTLRPLDGAVHEELDAADRRSAREGAPGERARERGAVCDAGRDRECRRRGGVRLRCAPVRDNDLRRHLRHLAVRAIRLHRELVRPLRQRRRVESPSVAVEHVRRDGLRPPDRSVDQELHLRRRLCSGRRSRRPSPKLSCRSRAASLRRRTTQRSRRRPHQSLQSPPRTSGTGSSARSIERSASRWSPSRIRWAADAFVIGGAAGPRTTFTRLGETGFPRSGECVFPETGQSSAREGDLPWNRAAGSRRACPGAADGSFRCRPPLD